MQSIQEYLRYVITLFFKLLGIDTVGENGDFIAY